MIEITKMFLTNELNRPSLRNDGKDYSIRKLKGIVIHWTGNISKGADALMNRNYFNSTDRFASAHYIVDDIAIIQCAPDNEVLWHVGDNPRFDRPIRNEILRKESIKNPNYYLIGIEMCVNTDSDWIKTYQNTVDLTRTLLQKYDLTPQQIYRHYDITGKDCPNMFLPNFGNNDWAWKIFIKDISQQERIKKEIVYKDRIVYRDRTFWESITDFAKKLFKR